MGKGSEKMSDNGKKIDFSSIESEAKNRIKSLERTRPEASELSKDAGIIAQSIVAALKEYDRQRNT